MAKKQILFEGHGKLTLTKMPKGEMVLEFREIVPFTLKEPKKPKKLKK